MQVTMDPRFKEFLLEGFLSDVVITAKGVDFKAHRVLLSGSSEYFRKMFCTPFVSEQQVYSFPDVSADTMQLILDYIYTGSVAVSMENVLELLAQADRFAIEDIIQVCSDFLEKQLSSKNCLDIWMLDVADSHKHLLSDLRQKAYEFILDHFEEVATSSPRFLELSLQQLVDLIEKDTLNVRQESAVLEAALRWIQHSPQERVGDMFMLMSKTRLLSVSTESLLEAQGHPLIRNSPACMGLIVNAQKNLWQRALTRPRLPSAVLVAVGGLVNGHPDNGIELYDVRADRWVTMSHRQNIQQAFHGCVYLGRFVYCVGGFDGNKCLNRVQKLSLVTGTYQEVNPMHAARRYVSVATLGGCVYAIGGFDGRLKLNSAERYCPETNQWTLVAPMHEHRSGAAAATLNGKVYVCGGYARNNPLTTAECYNPYANLWTRITPMVMSQQASQAIAYRGHIYVVGGYTGRRALSGVSAYDPQTNEWTVMPPMIGRRSSCGIAVLEDQLYVAGGIDGGYAISSVERFDGETSQWHRVHGMVAARGCFGCCTVDRNAYHISPPRRDTTQSE